MASANSDYQTQLRTRTTRLTNADIKSLPSKPVTVVPAPGLGRSIAINRLDLSLFCKDEQGYANTDPNAILDLRYAGGGFQSLLLPFNSATRDTHWLEWFLQQTAHCAIPLYGYLPTGEHTAEGTFDALNGTSNQSVRLTLYNASAGDLTGGDPGNFLIVRVGYYIVKSN